MFIYIPNSIYDYILKKKKHNTHIWFGSLMATAIHGAAGLSPPTWFQTNKQDKYCDQVENFNVGLMDLKWPLLHR